MQLRFFTVPIHAPDAATAELNQFLVAHRILSIDRQLISDGANSVWTICVSFDDGTGTAIRRAPFGKRGKVDFRDLLSEPEFAVFARLRALRKERADAEGVPAYVGTQRNSGSSNGFPHVAGPSMLPQAFVRSIASKNVSADAGRRCTPNTQIAVI